MLFNSYIFVLVFLPLTLLGFYVFARVFGYRASRFWLIAASLFFYAWWNPIYIWLLLGSVFGNFAFGQLLQKISAHNKKYLMTGIAANLLLLGYFKYANFFIANINALNITQLPILHIILPLGISFFTLQQMAFLFDTYEGLTEEKSLMDYVLFATFFPLLLSGPIVHHRDVSPQFRKPDAGIFRDRAFAFGLFIFAIGLFKKTVIADSLTAMVAAGFDTQSAITATDAWLASLAFTLRAYFDFSGYSDMAVGIGLLLNIRLPLNFNSPYQATSIIQFWQRWHMTLTDFINAYVYMPLMRLRKTFSFYYSLCVTVVAMTVVGLWHGASWNYVLFGSLHGLALVVNHLWRRFGFSFHKALAWLLTILWWHFTLVIFRASTMDAAFRIFHALFSGTPAWIGKNMYEAFPVLAFLPVEILTFVMFLLFGALFACCVRLKNPHDHSETFTVSLRYFFITLFCLVSSVLLMDHVTEFIYFQF
jgi:D-alanyl-lipoteichoic acid acyltransferase DltB (MBOAT superfamily)